jgi:hypothetical protein
VSKRRAQHNAAPNHRTGTQLGHPADHASDSTCLPNAILLAVALVLLAQHRLLHATTPLRMRVRHDVAPLSTFRPSGQASTPNHFGQAWSVCIPLHARRGPVDSRQLTTAGNCLLPGALFARPTAIVHLLLPYGIPSFADRRGSLATWCRLPKGGLPTTGKNRCNHRWFPAPWWCARWSQPP